MKRELNMFPLAGSFAEILYEEKWLWPIFVCKVGQSDPIVMKLELNVWRCIFDIYTKVQIDISKHVQKSLENFRWRGGLLSSPFRVFLSATGPKLPDHDENH